MRWGSRELVLLASLTGACSGEIEPRVGEDELPELPFQQEALDAGSTDARVRPDARRPMSTNDGGGWDDPLTEDSACAASSVAAEQVVVEEQVQVEVTTEVPAPVALYVLFDKSQSMDWGSLWSPAVQAFKDFVRDPSSEGMDLALQYFPNGGQCNGDGYDTPAVALGRLPAHANAVVDSLSGQRANGIGTPIEGALRGATEYCTAFQATHADQKCVAVLVTDGKPEWDNCEKDTAKLTKIAADAWSQHKVRTFAVGLDGADFGLLDKIAQAGGAADCAAGAGFACDVSGGADQLSAALGKIRDTVTEVKVVTETRTETKQRPLECEWQMPKPAEGVQVDANQVNVTLNGANSKQLGRVPSAAECRADGWFFDDANAPQRIVACPQTCEDIKSGGYTDVKILLGCQTIILI